MKNRGLCATILGLLLSLSVHAGEGMLGLITVPQDADIYVDCDVNCEPKVNSTPAILTLSAGTHWIEARKDGQSVKLKVEITDGAVLSKKMVLIESCPSLPFEDNNVSISEILNPKRDSFETEKVFQKRRNQLLKKRQSFIDKFNLAVQQHNSGDKAGVAHLDKEYYDIESNRWIVRIEWNKWAKALDLPEQSYISATGTEAKNLWNEGQEKPVFVYLKVDGDKIKVNNFVLIGNKIERKISNLELVGKTKEKEKEKEWEWWEIF